MNSLLCILDSCEEYDERRRVRLRLKALMADKNILDDELKGHGSSISSTRRPVGSTRAANLGSKGVNSLTSEGELENLVLRELLLILAELRQRFRANLFKYTRSTSLESAYSYSSINSCKVKVTDTLNSSHVKSFLRKVRIPYFMMGDSSETSKSSDEFNSDFIDEVSSVLEKLRCKLKKSKSQPSVAGMVSEAPQDEKELVTLIDKLQTSLDSVVKSPEPVPCKNKSDVSDDEDADADDEEESDDESDDKRNAKVENRRSALSSDEEDSDDGSQNSDEEYETETVKTVETAILKRPSTSSSADVGGKVNSSGSESFKVNSSGSEGSKVNSFTPEGSKVNSSGSEGSVIKKRNERNSTKSSHSGSSCNSPGSLQRQPSREEARSFLSSAIVKCRSREEMAKHQTLEDDEEEYDNYETHPSNDSSEKVEEKEVDTSKKKEMKDLPWKIRAAKKRNELFQAKDDSNPPKGNRIHSPSIEFNSVLNSPYQSNSPMQSKSLSNLTSLTEGDQASDTVDSRRHVDIIKNAIYSKSSDNVLKSLTSDKLSNGKAPQQESAGKSDDSDESDDEGEVFSVKPLQTGKPPPLKLVTNNWCPKQNVAQKSKPFKQIDKKLVSEKSALFNKVIEANKDKPQPAVNLAPKRSPMVQRKLENKNDKFANDKSRWPEKKSPDFAIPSDSHKSPSIPSSPVPQRRPTTLTLRSVVPDCTPTNFQPKNVSFTDAGRGVTTPRHQQDGPDISFKEINTPPIKSNLASSKSQFGLHDENSTQQSNQALSKSRSTPILFKFLNSVSSDKGKEVIEPLKPDPPNVIKPCFTSKKEAIHSKLVSHIQSKFEGNVTENQQSSVPRVSWQAPKEKKQTFERKPLNKQSSMSEDPSKILFTPEQLVKIAIHKAAINKQLDDEEERRKNPFIRAKSVTESEPNNKLPFRKIKSIDIPDLSKENEKLDGPVYPGVKFKGTSGKLKDKLDNNLNRLPSGFNPSAGNKPHKQILPNFTQPNKAQCEIETSALQNFSSNSDSLKHDVIPSTNGEIPEGVNSTLNQQNQQQDDEEEQMRQRLEQLRMEQQLLEQKLADQEKKRRDHKSEEKSTNKSSIQNKQQYMFNGTEQDNSSLKQQQSQNMTPVPQEIIDSREVHLLPKVDKPPKNQSTIENIHTKNCHSPPKIINKKTSSINSHLNHGVTVGDSPQVTSQSFIQNKEIISLPNQQSSTLHINNISSIYTKPNEVQDIVLPEVQETMNQLPPSQASSNQQQILQHNLQQQKMVQAIIKQNQKTENVLKNSPSDRVTEPLNVSHGQFSNKPQNVSKTLTKQNSVDEAANVVFSVITRHKSREELVRSRSLSASGRTNSQSSMTRESPINDSVLQAHVDDDLNEDVFMEQNQTQIIGEQIPYSANHSNSQLEYDHSSQVSEVKKCDKPLPFSESFAECDKRKSSSITSLMESSSSAPSQVYPPTTTVLSPDTRTSARAKSSSVTTLSDNTDKTFLFGKGPFSTKNSKSEMPPNQKRSAVQQSKPQFWSSVPDGVNLTKQREEKTNQIKLSSKSSSFKNIYQNFVVPPLPKTSFSNKQDSQSPKPKFANYNVPPLPTSTHKINAAKQGLQLTTQQDVQPRNKFGVSKTGSLDVIKENIEGKKGKIGKIWETSLKPTDPKANSSSKPWVGTSAKEVAGQYVKKNKEKLLSSNNTEEVQSGNEESAYSRSSSVVTSENELLSPQDTVKESLNKNVDAENTVKSKSDLKSKKVKAKKNGASNSKSILGSNKSKSNNQKSQNREIPVSSTESGSSSKPWTKHSIIELAGQFVQKNKEKLLKFNETKDKSEPHVKINVVNKDKPKNHSELCQMRKAKAKEWEIAPQKPIENVAKKVNFVKESEQSRKTLIEKTKKLYEEETLSPTEQKIDKDVKRLSRDQFLFLEKDQIDVQSPTQSNLDRVKRMSKAQVELWEEGGLVKEQDNEKIPWTSSILDKSVKREKLKFEGSFSPTPPTPKSPVPLRRSNTCNVKSTFENLVDSNRDDAEINQGSPMLTPGSDRIKKGLSIFEEQSLDGPVLETKRHIQASKSCVFRKGFNIESNISDSPARTPLTPLQSPKRIIEERSENFANLLDKVEMRDSVILNTHARLRENPTRQKRPQSIGYYPVAPKSQSLSTSQLLPWGNEPKKQTSPTLPQTVVRHGPYEPSITNNVMAQKKREVESFFQQSNSDFSKFYAKSPTFNKPFSPEFNDSSESSTPSANIDSWDDLLSESEYDNQMVDKIFTETLLKDIEVNDDPSSPVTEGGRRRSLSDLPKDSIDYYLLEAARSSKVKRSKTVRGSFVSSMGSALSGKGVAAHSSTRSSYPKPAVGSSVTSHDSFLATVKQSSETMAGSYVSQSSTIGMSYIDDDDGSPGRRIAEDKWKESHHLPSYVHTLPVIPSLSGSGSDLGEEDELCDEKTVSCESSGTLSDNEYITDSDDNSCVGDDMSDTDDSDDNDSDFDEKYCDDNDSSTDSVDESHVVVDCTNVSDDSDCTEDKCEGAGEDISFSHTSMIESVNNTEYVSVTKTLPSINVTDHDPGLFSVPSPNVCPTQNELDDGNYRLTILKSEMTLESKVEPKHKYSSIVESFFK